jgi:bacillithiol synthase
MDCRALLPGQLPHTSKLIRDFVEDFSKVSAFYAHPPTLKSAASYAKQLSFPADRRREVAAALRAQNASFGSSSETQTNLRRLEQGAVAVVSGQQVGLFGGPAYAFYKALSAIETARQLTHSGIEAVPVFWMASEDHDVDEVRHIAWFDDGNLHELVLPKPAEDSVPVGRICLGPQIDGLLREARENLSGPDAATVMEILRQSYRPEETYGSAFGKLFARIFAGSGLILLDPLDPTLHRIAAPVLQQALSQRDLLNDLLLERGKQLERAGYDVQVKVTSRSTLLFSLEGGQRHVISASNGQFSCTEKSAPREECLQRLQEQPEKFSPNALLRPLIQDFLLPTAAYFGGPAEIAYYAQSHVLYEKLLGRMPVILMRADFTLVDPKGQRILKKFKLKIEDVWCGPQVLRKKMYDANVPKKLAREFEADIRQIEKSIRRLHKAIAKVDPTIQGTIARAEKRIHYQLEKLRHKTGSSLDRHEKILEQHERFLHNLLYPQKGLQSRDLSFLPFLARWGWAGLHELQELASAKKPGRHLICPIP